MVTVGTWMTILETLRHTHYDQERKRGGERRVELRDRSDGGIKN